MCIYTSMTYAPIYIIKHIIKSFGKNYSAAPHLTQRNVVSGSRRDHLAAKFMFSKAVNALHVP